MASGSGAEPAASPATLARCAAAWAVAQRVTVAGCEPRYREAGEGAPIVLVHGLGLSADYWWRNGPRLAAAGHRVLAPDLPGFGRSAGPEGGLSVIQQAEALLAWLEALELPPATLVGHSLSCQSVMEVAANHPERVAGLVLTAPTGEPGRGRLLHQAVGLLRDIPRESFRLAMEVATAYALAGPRRVWRTWKMGGHHDPLPLVPRILAPAIVVLGTRDPVVPVDFARTLAAGLGGREVRWIPDAAHALIFTHAEEFNRVVLGFVQEARG